MGGINHQTWVVYDIAIPTLIHQWATLMGSSSRPFFFQDGLRAIGILRRGSSSLGLFLDGFWKAKIPATKMTVKGILGLQKVIFHDIFRFCRGDLSIE